MYTSSRTMEISLPLSSSFNRPTRPFSACMTLKSSSSKSHRISRFMSLSSTTRTVRRSVKPSILLFMPVPSPKNVIACRGFAQKRCLSTGNILLHSLEECKRSFAFPPFLRKILSRPRQNKAFTGVGEKRTDGPVSGPPVRSRWSGQRGSNSLPPPWQGGALPDELCPHEQRIV